MLDRLFGSFVRTAVNTALLPIAVARDVVTLAGTIDNDNRPHTLDALARLKREATEGAGDGTP